MTCFETELCARGDDTAQGVRRFHLHGRLLVWSFPCISLSTFIAGDRHIDLCNCAGLNFCTADVVANNWQQFNQSFLVEYKR